MIGFYMKRNTGLKRANPFQASTPLLCYLKTLENLWFIDVLRGYGKGTLT